MERLQNHPPPTNFTISTVSPSCSLNVSYVSFFIIDRFTSTATCSFFICSSSRSSVTVPARDFSNTSPLTISRIKKTASLWAPSCSQGRKGYGYLSYPYAGITRIRFKGSPDFIRTLRPFRPPPEFFKYR